MTSNNPGLTHVLYDLGPEQRAYLEGEYRPSRREARKLGPYPVTPETAATVEALRRNYVLPWDQARDLHLAMWTRDTLIARGARDIPLINSLLMPTRLKLFRHIGEARKYWAGTDYQNGFSDVPDAEYEGILARHQAAAAAIALEDPIKAGAAVYMPELPFGPSALRYIPLIKCRWIDLEVLVLCEAGALLGEEGMVRLPPSESHPLAWDRFCTPDTDWSDPRPARPEVLATALTQARANVSRCPGKPHIINGRPHLPVEHYFHWRGRHVRCPLESRRVEGLIVTTWNDWIDRESETGWLEVAGHLIGKVEHPCPLRAGQDYQTVRGACALREALTHRAAALATLRDRATGS